MINFKDFIEEENMLQEAVAKSGYSDEHAFAHVWNHAIGKGIAHDLPAIKAEIDKAKKDPKHTLNINRKPMSSGFKKGSKPEESSYYNELHNAAKSVSSVANHSDFHESVAKKHIAEVAGASRGALSEKWKKHGATDATSKADIIIKPNPSVKKEEGEPEQGSKHISYKKGGGSQFMSAESKEFSATYTHVADKLKDLGDANGEGGITPDQHQKIIGHVKEISENLQKMKGTDYEKGRQLKDRSQTLLNDIHAQSHLFNNYVHHEAASGHAKFAGGEGTATHVVTSAEGEHEPEVADVNHYLHKKPEELSMPRVALPKDRDKNTGLSTRPGNVKADKLSKPKTKKNIGEIIKFSNYID